MNCTQYTITEKSDLRLVLAPGGTYKLYLVIDETAVPPSRSFVSDLAIGGSSTTLSPGVYEVCDESNDCGEISFSEVITASGSQSFCPTEINKFTLPGRITTSDTGFVPVTIYQTNASETVIAHGTMEDDGVITIIESQTFAGFSQNNFPAAAYDIDTDNIYGVAKDAAGDSVIFYSVDSGGTYTVLEPAIAFPAGISIIGAAFGNDGLLYAVAQQDGAAPNDGRMYTLDRNNPSAAPVLVTGFNISGVNGGNVDNVFDKESMGEPGTMFYHNGAEIYKVTDVNDFPATQTLLATLAAAPGSGSMTILGDFVKVISASNEIVLIHKETGAITTGPTITIPQLTAAAPVVSLIADMAESEPDTITVEPDRNITEIVQLCCTGKTRCYLEGDLPPDPSLTAQEIAALKKKSIIPIRMTVSGQLTIPAGVKSYSIEVTSGPVLVDGVSYPTGTSDVLSHVDAADCIGPIEVDATGGEAIVVYVP